jgi:hypothetical protein
MQFSTSPDFFSLFPERRGYSKYFREKKQQKSFYVDLNPPKYSVSWIAKRIKGRSSKLLRDMFPYLKEWCPDHLWAPSCYHGLVGHGWEVVEKYISGQKGYCCAKTDTLPVVVIDEEKEKALKTGYITLYAKLFKGVVCTSR